MSVDSLKNMLTKMDYVHWLLEVHSMNIILN